MWMLMIMRAGAAATSIWLFKTNNLNSSELLWPVRTPPKTNTKFIILLIRSTCHQLKYTPWKECSISTLELFERWGILTREVSWCTRLREAQGAEVGRAPFHPAMYLRCLQLGMGGDDAKYEDFFRWGHLRQWVGPLWYPPCHAFMLLLNSNSSGWFQRR